MAKTNRVENGSYSIPYDLWDNFKSFFFFLNVIWQSGVFFHFGEITIPSYAIKIKVSSRELNSVHFDFISRKEKEKKIYV